MPVPYAGEEFTFHNPDGSPVMVRGWGTQFAAVFETLDGYTVVKDPESGYFHYAALTSDGDDLVPSGSIVGSADPQTLGMTAHLRPAPHVTRARAQVSRETHGAQRRWEVRRAQRRARLQSRADAVAPAEEPEPAGKTGSYVGLCLLVQFPDVPGSCTQAQVESFCNQPGYSGFGNNGSVHDYFLAVSDGRLSYTNQVAAYYTAKHPRSYYTDPGTAFGTRAQELIGEALQHLKASGFDFSGLSSDSDGFVYALNVFYAGPTVNNWSEGLWPHSSALSSTFTASPTKKLADYQITDMGSQLTLRTFCHENGHMVCDFPDLYDYGSEGNGVGHYCLMCFGGSDTNPTQVDAYLKHVAGWTSSIMTLAPGLSATLAAGANEFLIHRKDANEYFILENRAKSGRDAALPDAGLAIWHVDQLGSNDNEQMTPGLHYECSLEQADNRFDLERGLNTGDADDLFGGAPASKFGAGTSPNSRWWDGTASGLEIAQISPPGSVVTVALQGAVTPSPAPAAAINLLLQ
jgi:M6 family metalloprotease-like protein